jgi:5'-nucleotidase
MVTRQGTSKWDDTFDVRRDPANREYFWLKGSLQVTDKDPDMDEIAVRNRYVSITPIHYELTDRRMLEEMRGWGLEALK